MKILLFGGTTEGRELSKALSSKGEQVTVCVATDYGREEQAQVEGVTILTGRKGPEEMRELMKSHDLVIDATHPYATEVTALLKDAASDTGTDYVRIRRTLTTTNTGRAPEHIHYYASAKDVAEALNSTEGNILLATGTKELPDFAGIAPERLIPRVLPSTENIAACEAFGIPRRNIVAMQGPFSTELNLAILHQKNIAFFVTKDGGTTGGFPEKAEASKQAGVPLLVVSPPEDEGVTVEEFLEDYQ